MKPFFIFLLILLCTGCTSGMSNQRMAVPAPSSISIVVPPTSPIPASPTAVRSLTITAVGDIMLGRNVGRSIARLGASYPFSATRELLRGDLVLGNLESPLTSRRAPRSLRPGPYRLPADPAAVAGLHDAGFKALTLANNHALDAGPQGLQEASEVLQSAGIAPLGVGAKASEAYKPQITEVMGWRVALLACNDVHDPQDQPDEAQGWGRAWLNDTCLAAVRDARAQADLVIVLIHWGTEYAREPDLRQREQAAALVAAGADVVLGAHPHVLQPIETLEAQGRRGLVAFSLGNFVFDQPFSPETSHSAILRVTLGATGTFTYTATPIAIVNGQPRPLAITNAAYRDVMKALGIAAESTLPEDQQPTTESTTATSSTRGYSWNGTTFSPFDLQSSALDPRPSVLTATTDLRGNGGLQLITVNPDGLAELHDGPTADAPVVWHNEDASWRVTGVVPGDADGDGRYEFLLTLWKPDATGALRSHPFMLGWRGGRYRIFWGGSAVSEPIQSAALGDVDGDGRDELVVLEGGNIPGDPAYDVGVWRWHGWGFERVWRGPRGPLQHLQLRDLNNDNAQEIVVVGKERS